MDPLSTTAAAGIRARMEALDLLANNLANSGTAGYKADRESYNLYMGADGDSAMAWSPVIQTHRTDFSQGQLIQTANPTDVALSGDGFLVANGPNGPLLTRNGRLTVTADGKLTTSDGFELATVEPRPIRLNPRLPFQITSDGTVTQEEVALGQLRIAGPAANLQPPRREGVYFRIDNSQLQNLPSTRYQLHQGQLEGSNVSPAESSVRLIGILRQFESLQRAMQLTGDMGRRAVEEVAKVTP